MCSLSPPLSFYRTHTIHISFSEGSVVPCLRVRSTPQDHNALFFLVFFLGRVLCQIHCFYSYQPLCISFSCIGPQWLYLCPECGQLQQFFYFCFLDSYTSTRFSNPSKHSE